MRDLALQRGSPAAAAKAVSSAALVQRPLPALIGVATACMVAYAAALANGYAYDDVPLVLGNPAMRALAGGDVVAALRLIATQPYWPAMGAELALYRPLTSLTLALDFALWNGHPLGLHLANVLWHTAASLLVLLLLRRLVTPIPAFAGALVFAVHPVHVEAVANIAGRAELVTAVFGLAACVLWLRGRRGDVSLAALCVLLALAAKESAIMLPALLLLLEPIRLRRDGQPVAASQAFAASLRERTSGWVLIGLALAAFVAARIAVLDGLRPAAVHAAADVLQSPLERVATALQAWPVYLRLLLAPTSLLADYGPRVLMPARGITPLAVMGGLVLVTLVGAGVTALHRREPRLALALLWLPLAILPVSNLLFPVGVIVAERTLYLPSFALSLGLGLVGQRVEALGSRGLRRAAAVALAVVALALLARTVSRVPEWRSTETIFAALVRDRPDSFRAHWYLGRAAREQGDLPLAQRHFGEAFRLWPYRERMVIEAAATALQAGALTEARELAGFAAERWPANADAHRLNAVSAISLADTTAARLAVRLGLRTAPTDPLLLEMASALRVHEEPRR
ncbi:MAG: hypothetical protein ACRELD_03625 [Longimicrobiales bacterium]